MKSIEVHSPDFSLRTRNGKVSLSHFTILDDFEVKISSERSDFTAFLILPEWLVHFTTFLKSEDKYEAQMILSGEWFRGFHLSDGKVQVTFFDRESRLMRTFVWENQWALEIHQALYNALHLAIDKAADAPPIVEDDHLIRLDDYG